MTKFNLKILLFHICMCIDAFVKKKKEKKHSSVFT